MTLTPEQEKDFASVAAAMVLDPKVNLSDGRQALAHIRAALEEAQAKAARWDAANKNSGLTIDEVFKPSPLEARRKAHEALDLIEKYSISRPDEADDYRDSIASAHAAIDAIGEPEACQPLSETARQDRVYLRLALETIAADYKFHPDRRKRLLKLLESALAEGGER